MAFDRDRDRDRGDKDKGAKFGGFVRDNRCRFCRDKVTVIDYKDVEILRKLLTTQGKIFSRKRAGNCARHQRQLGAAIKRARFMALLAFDE
jgi:small subunit ribosomal protein S18